MPKNMKKGGDALSDFFNQGSNAIKGAVSSVNFTELGNQAKEGFNKVGSQAKSFYNSDTFKNGASSAWSGVKSTGSSIGRNFGSIVGDKANNPTRTFEEFSLGNSSRNFQSKHAGRRRMTRRSRRRMSGGYTSNISMTNLASKSAPISGIKTAQPHNWVGGKRRTRKLRKGRKSRKSKRRH